MKKVLKDNINDNKFTLFLILILIFCIFTNTFMIEEKSFSYDPPIDVNAKIEEAVGENEKLSNFYLNLKNITGKDGFTHPKVISFKNKWNGYKYWITYTPYPKGDQSQENPHIMVSNDLISWVEKDGFTNPLDEVITDNSKKVYNSDPHLVYNSDTNKIECYWRYVDDTINKVIIYRKTSDDGVNWSEKEIFLENQRNKVDYLSPSIIYEGGKYMVWYVDRNRIIKYVEYYPDKEEWSNVRTLDIKYKNPKLESWHLDVIKTKKGYESIIVAFDDWNKRSTMKLYYSFSEDNVNWTLAEEILSSLDKGGIYRSSILYLNNTYYIFYSEITKKYKRGIGIVYGSDITKLSGLQLKDVNKFIEYIKANS